MAGNQCTIYILGKVENISDSAVRAEIKVEFINKEWEVVQTQVVIVELNVGQTEEYRVYHGGVEGGWSDPSWNTEDYHISVSTVS